MKLFALCAVLLGVGVVSVSATCTSFSEFVSCINTVAKPTLTVDGPVGGEVYKNDMYIHLDWATVTAAELKTAYCGNLDQLNTCIKSWGSDTCVSSEELRAKTMIAMFGNYVMGLADALALVCQRDLQALIDSRRCAIQNNFDSSISASEIFTTVGYTDSANFSTGFLKHMGIIYNKTVEFCNTVADKKVLTMFAGTRFYSYFSALDKQAQLNKLLPIDQLWPWKDEVQTKAAEEGTAATGEGDSRCHVPVYTTKHPEYKGTCMLVCCDEEETTDKTADEGTASTGARDPKCNGVGYRAKHPECEQQERPGNSKKNTPSG